MAMPPASRRAFSLIEVLVAMALFTLGLLAIGALGMQGMRLGGMSLAQTRAAAHVKSALESMRAEGFPRWSSTLQESGSPSLEVRDDVSGMECFRTIRRDTAPAAPAALYLEAECRWIERAEGPSFSHAAWVWLPRGVWR